LKEEHRLRVFENWVLMKILAPERDEVTGEWRRQLAVSYVVCTAHGMLLW
jgi:hypothetical protein